MDVRLLDDPRPLAELAPGTRVAIDTEFHAERHYRPRLHLIQVRPEAGPAWLVDPHRPELLSAIATGLRSASWIVHSGTWDLPLLAEALGGVASEVMDTQIAAGLIGPHYPAGLARLCKDQLGTSLDKGETLSDWSRRPLSPAQIRYAGSDVWVLHALWDKLYEQAASLGRTSIVRAACREAAEHALAGPSVDEAWMAIPGHATLGGRAAGVLQELAAWRELIARAEDQPAHTLVANRVLLDLAKREPLTEATLLAGRGAPRALLKKYADALLERIARASARPTWSWPPLVAPGTLDAARAAWVRAWAEDRALRERWSARLVLPDVAINRLALGQPAAEVLDGWRAELLVHHIVGGWPCDPLPWPAPLAPL
jgi:ribonuclease D